MSTMKLYIQHCNMSVSTSMHILEEVQVTVQLLSYRFGCGACIALDVKTVQMHK